MSKNFYYPFLLSCFLISLQTADNCVYAFYGVAPAKANYLKKSGLTFENNGAPPSSNMALERPEFVPAQPPEFDQTDIAFYISNRNEGAYVEIYRSMSDTLNFQLVATHDEFLFVDPMLRPRTVYYYKLRAVLGSEVSGFSETRIFATRSISYPPTVTATVIDENTIEFSITDNSYNEYYYEIEEISPGNDFFEEIIFSTDSGGTQTVGHGGALPNTTYTYSIRMAVMADGAPEIDVGEITVTTHAVCENTGYIVREVWRNVPGTDVSAIPLSQPPTETTELWAFEAPSNNGTNYGARIRGYLCPPLTGNYTFWIASDDKSELYLSSDENPANKTKIASVNGHTSVRQWNKYATQQSASIHLTAGYQYYIEALHKEASGGDHLAVGWQLPDGTMDRPINGNRLIPFTELPDVACEGTGSIKWEVWNNISGTTISPIVYDQMPDLTTTLPIFETPQYHGNNYASRIRGYLCPPVSGDYTFWVSGDDMTELWLSTNDDPSNRNLIASVAGHTPYRKWDKYPSQQSGVISLEAGQRYYVEVRHKEGSGADHISVGWQVPGREPERPIQGNYLIPFEDVAPNCAEIESGPVMRQIWLNIPGTAVASIPTNTPADAQQFLGDFETVTYYGNNYGSRIQAWVCVPVTGNYTFWISSDDNGELWLGTTDNPSTRRKIASVPGATNVRQWDKYAAQQSAPIYLQAGYKYYIEALQKEANGNDHVEVGWQLPDGTLERPIPGDRLIMYGDDTETSQARAGDVTIMDSRELEEDFVIYPNPSKGRNIELSLRMENAIATSPKIEIVSVTGKVLHEQVEDCQDRNCDRIPVVVGSHIPPGIYLVNVFLDRKRLTKKLIIE